VEASVDLEQDFATPYLAFMQAIDAAVPDADLKASASRAFADYLTAAEAAGRDGAGKAAGEAYAVWRDAVKAALASAADNGQVRDAFRVFVTTVRDSWLRIDIDSMDAATLAAVADMMLRVTWFASAAAEMPSTADATPPGTWTAPSPTDAAPPPSTWTAPSPTDAAPPPSTWTAAATSAYPPPMSSTPI
jgi:hypothetical protein